MKDAIFITGGTGILGRPLVKKLLAEKYPVYMLCRNPGPPKEGVIWVPGDLLQPHMGIEKYQYSALASRIKQVFHLGARTDFNGSTLKDYYPLNVDGMRKAFEFSVSCRSHFHYVSTAFVCGSSLTFHEQQLDVGQSFRNAYEESKFCAEKLLHNLSDHNTIPWNIYRPGILLTEEQGGEKNIPFGPLLFLKELNYLENYLEKNRLIEETPFVRIHGDPSGRLPFLEASVVADVLVRLFHKEKNSKKVFHVVPRDSFDNDSLKKVVNECLSRPLTRWASSNSFESRKPTRVEKLLARKTALYAPYLSFHTTFSRHNLEKTLGKFILPCPSEHILKKIFLRYLCRKNSKSPQKSVLRISA